MTETTKKIGWFERFLRWREQKISERNFVVVVAVVVGAAAGLAAVLLKWLIASIAGLLTSTITTEQGNALYLVFPAVGIMLTSIYVYYIARENISHGVTRVLYAIALKKSRLKRGDMFHSLIASAVTIGFGGSVGAEGPIVYTGAAIGSNVGSALRLTPQTMMLLVGCGAAAGIAGIFKAPIAGMLFAVEVLMLDLTAGAALPLIMASVAGATVAYIFTGYNVEFFFSQSEPFFASRIPFVLLLGVVCGLMSVYFNKVMARLEKLFKRITSKHLKVIVGSITLGILIFLLPPLYGEGYDAITNLINGDVDAIMSGSLFYGWRGSVWAVLLFVVALAALKVFATAATTGGGGVGGTFAPSLFVGCMVGFAFAWFVNSLGFIDPANPLSIKNFALLGMAGVIAGVMHAPLMAIFLTAEMTGGYELFLPLLIVAAISYATSRIFMPYGIYARRLAERGELLTHQKDQTVLTLLKMDSVIETDFLIVHPSDSLKEMVDTISKSRRNLFAVTDDNDKLLGIVQLDDIRNIMFRPDLYRRMTVSEFMARPPAKIVTGTSMEQVMKTFDDTGAWNLPVVDPEGKYVGFVSKSKIFNSYRQVLKHYSYD